MVDVIALLDDVVGHLAVGEARPGQREMAQAVANAVTQGRHLVVQAGTGTGKSLGYLVPLLASGKRTVVATATKALQDQLAGKDLPFLATVMPPFTFAVLKGRSNYVCRQRLDELSSADGAKLELDGANLHTRAEIRIITEWAETTRTGDRAELDFEPRPESWQAVSVSSAECPGRNKCPSGGSCFSEMARDRAAEADIIVTNLHLYGLHIASGGFVLPEHDVVVIDEAHQLEDVISATAGLELTGGRFHALSRTARTVLEGDDVASSLTRAGADLAAALTPHIGNRVQPLPEDIHRSLMLGRSAANELISSLRTITTDVADAKQKVTRAMQAATTLVAELDEAVAVPVTAVAWVEGEKTNPRLRVAPIDVGPVLEVGLWEAHPTILTSATIPLALPDRLSMDPDTFDALDVGSPFDYEHQALLYCARHLPAPRDVERFDAAMHEELESLIVAAGGRTLALFTSWRSLRSAVEKLRPRLAYTILMQSDLPTPALIEQFTHDESTCLFATTGLFQGIDVPGRTLSLVTIDRLPFPRPDEPLLQARREAIGERAFAQVDLPRATTLLAQAAGRLIRNGTDRGVVAVFDPRLSTARYSWQIVQALPPMRRTRDRDDAEDFLRSITR